MSDIIGELYEIDRFEYILNEAKRNTATGHEEVMVGNIIDSYKRFGKYLFLAQQTREHLERIAKNEN